MNHHITIVCPGQGSQSVGMLSSFDDDFVNFEYEKIKDLFDFNLIDIIQNNPNNLLNQSRYTQPAILFTSYLYWIKIKDLLPHQPNLLAGHSLGEFTALTIGGAFSLRDALYIVHKRGAFMEAAKPSAMAAVLNLNLEDIITITNELNNTYPDEYIAPVNINSPKQTVIGGTREIIDMAENFFKEKGAKRYIKLDVSTASHCNIMKEAALMLNDELNSISISNPVIPILQNIDAKSYTEKSKILKNLTSQLIHPVQWVNTMKTISDKDGLVIECGPGKVLAGLGKANNCPVININDDFKDKIKDIYG